MPAERQSRKPDGGSHPYSKPEVKPEVRSICFLDPFSDGPHDIPMDYLEPENHSLSLAKRILLSGP